MAGDATNTMLAVRVIPSVSDGPGRWALRGMNIEAPVPPGSSLTLGMTRAVSIVFTLLLPATCDLLPATCDLLPAACYLLPATCYLLRHTAIGKVRP